MIFYGSSLFNWPNPNTYVANQPYISARAVILLRCFATDSEFTGQLYFFSSARRVALPEKFLEAYARAEATTQTLQKHPLPDHRRVGDFSLSLIS